MSPRGSCGGVIEFRILGPLDAVDEGRTSCTSRRPRRRVRLEEARLEALELRVEADLKRGQHAVLVGELEALVAEHPPRDRLRSQLMLALYRSERQAEALPVYEDGRRLLVDELGIEPSRVLQQLERAILVQDPRSSSRPCRWPRRQ